MEWCDLDWFDQSFLEAKIQGDVQTVNCRGICMDLWQSYTDKNIDFGWEKALINSRFINWLFDCKFASCENCMMDMLWYVKRENKNSLTNTFSSFSKTM